MKKLIFSLALLAAGLGLVSCGYTTKSALPAGQSSIFVTPFKNKINYTAESATRTIYIPLLEIKVHDAVVDRFLFDGRLHIVPEDQADLVLKGELTAFQRGVLSYTDNLDVQEYRIQVFVNLTLQERETGKTVWQENGFVGEATYFLSGPQAKSESAAIEDATADLARRVVERTVENW